MAKFNDISKNIIAKMTAEEVFEKAVEWAKDYDEEFAKYLETNKDYVIKVLGIDRYTPKPRKDIAAFGEIKQVFSYMFDPYFKHSNIADFEIDPQNFKKAKEVVSAYAKIVSAKDEKDVWFAKIKELASSLGYATDNKAYKANPENFKGNVAQVCEFIRVALTGRKNSPDLFEIISILGQDKTEVRLQEFAKKL